MVVGGIPATHGFVLTHHVFVRVSVCPEYSNDARLVGVWFDFKFSGLTYVRHLLYVRPWRFLLVVFAVLLTCLSYALLYCERALPVIGGVKVPVREVAMPGCQCPQPDPSWFP